MANPKAWVGGLGVALIIAAAACENASDPVPSSPVPTQSSRLVITDAQPADGNARLTGIGVSHMVPGTDHKIVHLGHLVGGIAHGIDLGYAISTDEIMSASHNWYSVADAYDYVPGYDVNLAECAGAGCGGEITVDTSARTMTITGVHLSTGTTTSTLNGTLSWE